MKYNFTTGYQYFNKIILTLLLIFTSVNWAFAVEESDELLVRGDSHYPPYEYLNESGEPEGFNIDIMRAVAEAMHMDIRIELGKWHVVRSAIETGQADILMGMFNTEERDKKVDFAIPHFIASYAIFVKEKSEIENLDDIRNKKIIVQKNDMGHDFVLEQQLSANLVVKDTPEEGFSALVRGEGDCLVLSRLQGVIILKEKGLKSVKIVGPPIIQRKYCMAVTEGNKELLAKLNEGLNIIKTSGEYDKIYDRWFGIYERGSVNLSTVIKWTAIIILPFIIVIVIIFFWNRTLQRRVDQRTEELEKSREDLHITLNSIGDAVIATDIQGNITNMNPVAEQLTGYKFHDVKGHHINEVFTIINSKTGEKAINPIIKVLREKKRVGLTNHTELIAKDGNEYQIADSAAPIKNSAGEIVGVVLVFRDVSKEYRTLEKLKTSEANLRTVFEAARNIAFIKTDVNGKFSKIEIFSPGGEEIFGYTREEIIGKPITLLARPTDEPRFSEILTIDNKDKMGFDCELEMVRKNGKTFPALFSTHHIFDEENRMVNALCVAIDITQQKRTQEELSKMQNIKSIGTLAGGIAHDFNNILTAIYGNISIAKLQLSHTHPVYDILNEAESSMNRATRLTRQLLTFSKGGDPHKTVVSLKDVIVDIVNFDLSGSNVKLMMEADDDLYPVKVDKGQMQQVFSNLAINANQAMPDGGKVTITMRNFDASKEPVPGLSGGAYLKITFKDEGSGIKKEYLDQIFDPYFTTKSTGSGLGLATVFSIINKHNGRIIVDSELNVGTNFTIYLPAAKSSKYTEETKIDEQDREQVEYKTKILIMDDDKSIRNLVMSMVRSLGMKVVAVDDGHAAVQEFKEAIDEGEPFDLVILDLTIPGGMGGKETCAAIQAVAPKAKIIVSSGYANDTVLANYQHYGFSDIIAKPYTINNLQSVIRRVLKDN
ncbi:MAG: PAS domain S-box protein [Fidelibacterota bacterium]